ncbi:hypothetical protein RB195_001985 [Necator americanus]|uniref:Reverse transcriptase domain-containing protein n=1 Tax=Necator americanus TaxID=51031 RepID=A0ABR1DHY4_NECAM
MYNTVGSVSPSTTLCEEHQCPADIVLAPSGYPLTDLEYADDVVIFAESSTKLQHVVNLVPKLTAAYGLRLRSDKCKQMWISSRPRTGIRVDGQPIELVDEFCYPGCTLKKNGSYERDVQQRCAKATSAFNSLTKCLRSAPNEVELRVYLSAIRPIMMYGSETWPAPSTVMERLDCTERKLLRRLLGHFWPRACHNEDLYAEIDVVYWRMTRGRYHHLAPPSKAAKVNRLRFFGHILRRPADRLIQRDLRSSSGSSWKKPPGRKRKFWIEVMKEDLRTFAVDRQFRRDVHSGIKGLVTDAVTGEPINEAIVWIRNGTAPLPIRHPVTTWLLGDYYRILPPGHYEVIVQAESYEPSARNVTVTNKVRDSATIVDFALKPLIEKPPTDEEIVQLVEALEQQGQE